MLSTPSGGRPYWLLVLEGKSVMEQMPDLSITTRHALQEAILTPRFYTTDFRAIDALDIDKNGLRDEFEWVRGEFAHDCTWTKVAAAD